MFMFSISANAQMLEDKIVEKKLKNIEIEKPKSNLEYNYESTLSIPIKLQILETLSTSDADDNLYDGKPVLFKVKQDVIYNDEVIVKKDEIVKAKVISYTTRGMNGIPASIFINDFDINGIDSNKLTDSYSKYGKNFVVWVLPLKYALTPFYPLGSLTNFILGTNAKISKNDNVTLYYYPEWGREN